MGHRLLANCGKAFDEITGRRDYRENAGTCKGRVSPATAIGSFANTGLKNRFSGRTFSAVPNYPKRGQA
jgi:hypothetical protein